MFNDLLTLEYPNFLLFVDNKNKYVFYFNISLENINLLSLWVKYTHIDIET